MPKEYTPEGKDLKADLYDCENITLLNNEEELIELTKAAILKSRAKLVKIMSNKFKPQGVTVLAIVEESHVAIHCSPEIGFASVSFYTCGTRAKPERGLELIVNNLKPKQVESTIIQRGNKKDLTISDIPTKRKTQPFGYSLLLDLYKCKPKKVVSNFGIAYDFLDTLPGKIGMEKQAPPFIFKSDATNYPDKAGFTGFVPLIDSGIQYHTLDPKQFITMDIYSCKEFDPDFVTEEVKKIYNPKDIDDQFLHRGVDY